MVAVYSFYSYPSLYASLWYSIAEGPEIFGIVQILQLMNDSNQSVRDAAISCIEVSWFIFHTV